jgi:hypothetical protein
MRDRFVICRNPDPDFRSYSPLNVSHQAPLSTK